MSALNRRERLRRRTAETMARYARAQTERERRRDQPPLPADLCVFSQTTESALQWAGIDREH